MSWRAKRVTVMGLGRFGGGVGVTRWLVSQGARVLVTDAAAADELAESIAQVDGLGVELRLGEHRHDDFRRADAVVVSPAVPDGSPYLATARQAGVPITTEINLFVERCRARIVGVTGSVGKSTTTAMLAHILERSAASRTWVGGNLGGSLLEALPNMAAEDYVVLELSSFQLQRITRDGWQVRLALITNLVPNHLDWHGGFEAYADAKLNLLRCRQPGRGALVIGDTSALRDRVGSLLGSLEGVWRYGLEGDEPVARRDCAHGPGLREEAFRWSDLRLAVPGRHNRENAAGALTAAHALGLSADDAVRALADFPGLPDRLEFVGEFAGVRYFNDSKATTPQAAITALESFEAPTLMIMGGYDKGSDLTDAARLAARRARYVACVGQTGPTIRDAVVGFGGTAEFLGEFDEGVLACISRARPGDVVVLSPGCASWDQFREYRLRGERFKQIVRAARGPTAEGAPGRESDGARG